MSDLSSRLVALQTTPVNYQTHYIASTAAFNNSTFQTPPANYAHAPQRQPIPQQVLHNYQNAQFAPTFQQHPHNPVNQFQQNNNFHQQVRQQPTIIQNNPNNFYTYTYNPNTPSIPARLSGPNFQPASEYDDSDSSDDDAELILKPLDLIRLEMPGDGACLVYFRSTFYLLPSFPLKFIFFIFFHNQFRAASHFIYGTGKFHTLVRRNVVREMIKRKEQFAPFIHDENNLERISMREYCANMLLVFSSIFSSRFTLN